MVRVVIGTKVCSFEEMLEEYGRISKENEELKKKISELESELEVKENLMSITSCYIGVGNTEALKKYGVDITSDEEEPLPFSYDECKGDRIDELEKRIAHLEDLLAEEVKRLEREIVLKNLAYDR